MEIERKFLVKELPAHLEDYPSHLIEQAYLCTSPVVRIRRQDEDYYLTYKGAGLMAREEYNLPLSGEAYRHLLPKADGTVITKRRFVIPGTEGHPGYGFKAWMKSYALPEHLLQWPLILCPLLAAIQAGLGLVMNALWQAV